jgi:hypothetical protein
LEYQKKESQRQHLRMHEDSEAVAQVMFEDDVPPPADKAA